MHRFYERLVVYFDGVSYQDQGGPAGCGWVIYPLLANGRRGKQLAEGYKYLGYNVSQQQSVYEGLEGALRTLWLENISCDSLHIRYNATTIIKQLQGRQKVQDRFLIPYYDAVQGILVNVSCGAVFYERSKNRKDRRDYTIFATEMANDAIANGDEHFFYSFF